MTRARELLDDALQLDEKHRATLALELLDSLSAPDARDEVAWLEEIERRARRALAGGASGRDVDEALESIARDLDL
jgi:hypothetical protein